MGAAGARERAADHGQQPVEPARGRRLPGDLSRRRHGTQPLAAPHGPRRAHRQLVRRTGRPERRDLRHAGPRRRRLRREPRGPRLGLRALRQGARRGEVRRSDCVPRTRWPRAHGAPAATAPRTAGRTRSSPSIERSHYPRRAAHSAGAHDRREQSREHDHAEAAGGRVAAIVAGLLALGEVLGLVKVGTRRLSVRN